MPSVSEEGRRSWRLTPYVEFGFSNGPSATGADYGALLQCNNHLASLNHPEEEELIRKMGGMCENRAARL